MTKTKLLAAGAALIFSASLAAAAPATVSTDLNMRSGPGTQYGVVASMPAGATVDVGGCTGSWCQVSFDGASGFANASYLSGGGAPSAAMVAPGYDDAPDYAYSDDYYDDGYSYGPSIGFYSGPRFRPGWHGRWHGPRTGSWQGRPGWQGGGNRVGAIGGANVNRGIGFNRGAPGSVTSLGGGMRPQMSAPVGLRSGGGAAFRGGDAIGAGGGARMGGGAVRAGGGPRGR